MMGLLTFLKGLVNPTAGWMESLPERLAVNLDDASLCGVPLGSRLDALSFLGPGSATASGQFR
jgi:hypothetical protein